MHLGLLLTLLTALGWALFDAVRKRLSREAQPLHLGLWLALGQAPLLAAWAAWREPFGLPGAALPALLGSTLLNLFALTAFLGALRRSPISLTIPLLSFTPVGTTLLAWAFRGQAPTAAQWGGSALVLAGAAVLGWSGGAWGGLRNFLKEPGVRRAALAALLWSATAILDQTAVAAGAGAWYAPILSAGVAVAMAVWLVAAGEAGALLPAARALAKVPAVALPALALGGFALAVQIESFRHAPIGFIEVVKRGVGMASAVLLGRIVFHEPVGGRKWAAVVLLTAGVALVVGLG